MQSDCETCQLPTLLKRGRLQPLSLTPQACALSKSACHLCGSFTQAQKQPRGSHAASEAIAQQVFHVQLVIGFRGRAAWGGSRRQRKRQLGQLICTARKALREGLIGVTQHESKEHADVGLLWNRSVLPAAAQKSLQPTLTRGGLATRGLPFSVRTFSQGLSNELLSLTNSDLVQPLLLS